MKRMALTIAFASTLAACGGDAESREDLEGQATNGSPATRATPAPPAQPQRAIQAGTVLTFEVRENVSTSSHTSGAGFSLVLVNGVSGTGGASLAAGAQARGVVTDVRRSSGPEEEAILGVRVASVEAGGSQVPIEGVVQSAAIETSAQDSGSRTAATIATGAAAGAILGQILGRDTRSTVTGAAVGTAVGVGVALTTRGGDASLPQGSRIEVRLDRDLVY